MPINSVLYEIILSAGMPMPDLPIYAVEYFGQRGEDLIVLSLLRALSANEGVDLSAEKYLEIGANHPIATSATYLLNKQLSMTGVLVEANPYLISALRRFRPDDVVLHTAVHDCDQREATLHISNCNELSSLDRSFIERWQDGAVEVIDELVVPAKRINDLMSAQFQRSPLFLSIDIEGEDLQILRDLDWVQWRPAIVQVEPSDHHHAGNSENISEYLESVGYVIIARTEINIIAMDAARVTPARVDIKESLASLRRALAESRSSLKFQSDEFAKLNAALRAKEDEFAALQNKNNEIMSSISWRLTGPIRFVVSAAERVRK